ncbi:MAG: helix-turn-helix domain-containing protein [Bacteroidota bacterium]|nr:helix-turn-helix domain-containing protein [Bacteroidota bacterium]
MNAELFPYRVALLKKSLFVPDKCCPIRQFSFSVVVFRSEESYSVSERRPAIMNQEKIGLFLKDLRKESGMTQEQLAEKLNVSNRTISRWENARTMPDFDFLIELAKIYDVSVEELLKGERTADMMEKQTEEALYNIAEYTSSEKERLLKNQHFFAWVGVICWIVFLGLKLAGLDETGITENIASFAAGLAFAMSIVSVIYTSKHISKIQEMKKRILKVK